MGTAPNELEAVARLAAEAGGALLRERWADVGSLVVEQKGHHDFVTEVDRAAERVVLDVIRTAFPQHAIMAEEGAPEADGAGASHRWIVDPLDGTTNFIHGVPVFGVSVAVEDDEGLAAGAIRDPLRRETFHASRGGGARCNDRPITVSGTDDPGRALLATGFPFRELSRLDGYLRAFEGFVRTTSGIRRAGAACIDLAWTASGRFDGFWELGLSRWDIAAGILLVREAGGVVTDVGGGQSMLETGDVLAAGPAMHDRMLPVTRDAFGD